MRTGKYVLIALTILFLAACEDANGPEGPNPPVVGKWAGRFEAKEYGILVKVVLEVDPDHTYRVAGTPSIAGMDSVRIYEEQGRWSIEGNDFIAAKQICRVVEPDDQVLRATPCPPDDTTAIEIVGDSLWTGKLRGQTVTLTRKP